MTKQQICECVTAALSQPLKQKGYELVEADYKTLYGEQHLMLYIDKPSGIGLDDCADVTALVDPILDAVNPTADAPYVLDVSSCGLDRPIKTPRDYERNLGREVEAKLYAPLNGKKTIEGRLVSRVGDAVTIEPLIGKEAPMILDVSKIALLTQLIRF